MKIKNYRNKTIFENYTEASEFIKNDLVKDANIVDGQEIFVRYYQDGIVETMVVVSYVGENGNVSFSVVNDLEKQISSINPVNYSPDEEDITVENNLLKFKNREYGDCLGYVILRTDKSFAEQVTGIPNTIFEVRYNFDLGGATVTLPDNATLKFVGGKVTNGKLKGNNLNFDWYDKNEETKWDANKRSLDKGKSFNNILKMVMQCLPSLRKTSFVKSINIYLDYGLYLVDEPIRLERGDDFSGGSALSVNIVGKGMSHTIIRTTFSDKDVADKDTTNRISYTKQTSMFVNCQEVIDGVTYTGLGFCTFEGISFQGANRADESTAAADKPADEQGIERRKENFETFMFADAGLMSNGTAYSALQNFKFVKCSFQYFKNIVVAEGDNMASEFFFSLCDINHTPEDGTVFTLNNANAVNYMLNQCCIETIYGSVIKLLKGSYVSITQSSIILDGGSAALIRTEDDSTIAGSGKFHINLDSNRYEFKNKAKILDLNNRDVIGINISNSRMGVTGANYCIMTIGPRTKLYFNNIDGGHLGSNTYIEANEFAKTNKNPNPDSTTYYTFYEFEIETNSQEFFDKLRTSPDFSYTYSSGGSFANDRRPIGNVKITEGGPTGRVYYRGKQYKIPYDYPEVAHFGEDASKRNYPEVKVDSVALTVQRDGLIEIKYSDNDTDKNTQKISIGKFVNKAEISLRQSSTIGGPRNLDTEGYTNMYALTFYFVKIVPSEQREFILREFTVKNYGNCEKFIDVFIGDYVDEIRVKTYYDNPVNSPNSPRRLRGHIDLYYR